MLETTTADSASPASAMVRGADGTVQRLVVGSRPNGQAVLTAVIDDAANILLADRCVPLPVIENPGTGSSPGSVRHAD